MTLNGWTKYGISGLLGVAVTTGFFLLNRHDAATTQSTNIISAITELQGFKIKIELNVEEWLKQEARQDLQIKLLEEESERARRERAELFQRVNRIDKP